MSNKIEIFLINGPDRMGGELWGRGGEEYCSDKKRNPYNEYISSD